MPASENISELGGAWSRWTFPAAAFVTVVEISVFLFGLQHGAVMPEPKPLAVRLIELPTPPATVREPELISEPAPASPPPAAEHEPPPPSLTPPRAEGTPTVPSPPSAMTPRDIAPPKPRPAPHPPKPGPAPTQPAVPQSPPAALAAPSNLPNGGTVAARAIDKPMPEIPDALRHRHLDLVALARFRIAADGHAEVELIEATPDPSLNRALLEALGRWRFVPALADGKPVAATIELRIPLTVR